MSAQALVWTTASILGGWLLWEGCYVYTVRLQDVVSIHCHSSDYANSGVPIPSMEGVSLTNASLEFGEVTELYCECMYEQE